MSQPQSGMIAEAEKAQLEIRPVASADAERLIVEAYATPAPVVRKVVEMLK